MTHQAIPRYNSSANDAPDESEIGGSAGPFHPAAQGVWRIGVCGTPSASASPAQTWPQAHGWDLGSPGLLQPQDEAGLLHHGGPHPRLPAGLQDEATRFWGHPGGGLPHQVPTTCAHQGGGQSHSNLGHPLNWARAGLPRTLAGHTAGVQLTLAERVNDCLVAAPWRAPGPLPEAQGRRHPWKPSPCRPRGREGAGTLAQGQLRWAVAPGQALQRQPRCQLKAVGGRGRKGIPAPGGEPPGPEPLTPQEWAESWGLLCLPPLLTCPLPSPGVTLERPQGRGHRSWTGRPARQTASHRRVRGGETRAGDQGFLAAAVPADYNQAGAQMRQAGAHPPPTPGQPDAPSLPRHPARSLPA